MESNYKSILFIFLGVTLSYFLDFSLVRSILVSVAVVFSLVCFGNVQKSPLPDGPPGLPILGHIPWLIRDRNGFLMRMYKKYGPIYTIKVGLQPRVIISGYELIREFTNHPDCQCRPDRDFLRKAIKGLGLLNSEGVIWKYQRRFAIFALKEYGMGKIRMNEKISQELATVTDIISKMKGQPMSFDELLKKSTCNVIFGLAFNKQHDYDDPVLIDQLKRMDQHVLTVGLLMSLSCIPFMSPLIKSKMKQFHTNLQGMLGRAEVIINEHLENFDPDDPKDFVDLYLSEMEKEATEETKEYFDTFSMEQLKFAIVSLFLAGTETSSTTILWALYYMALHPEIQTKVQAELDSVVGVDRTPVIEDKANLPYTVATLQEVERMATVVPGGLPRSNDRPVEFNGYTFPTRTGFIVNYQAVNHDPRLWENPYHFLPSRFVDAEGKVFRPPYLLPFGSGKRNCAGEPLARSEIFMYFSTLFQQFRFEPVSENDLSSFKNVAHVINTPGFFKLKALARF